MRQVSVKGPEKKELLRKIDELNTLCGKQIRIIAALYNEIDRLRNKYERVQPETEGV